MWSYRNSLMLLFWRVEEVPLLLILTLAPFHRIVPSWSPLFSVKFFCLNTACSHKTRWDLCPALSDCIPRYIRKTKLAVLQCDFLQAFVLDFLQGEQTISEEMTDAGYSNTSWTSRRLVFDQPGWCYSQTSPNQLAAWACACLSTGTM